MNPINQSNLLFTFSADIKTIVIIVLLSILFGVFLTIRNHHGGGAYVENKSLDGSFMLLLLVLIGGIVLYHFFTPPEDEVDVPKTQVESPIEQFLREGNSRESVIEKAEPVPPKRVDRDAVHFVSSNNQSVVSPARQRRTNYIMYAIQVAAVSTEDGARQTVSDLFQHDVEIFLEGGLYKVLVMNFTSREEAEAYEQKYKLEGFIRVLEFNDWTADSERF